MVVDDEDIPPASPEEVRVIIKNFKQRKVPNVDGISIRALKNLPRKAIIDTTNVFNVMLSLSHCPSPWTCADVVIHKRGQPATRSENYRSISLLATLGKMLNLDSEASTTRLCKYYVLSNTSKTVSTVERSTTSDSADRADRTRDLVS